MDKKIADEMVIKVEISEDLLRKITEEVIAEEGREKDKGTGKKDEFVTKLHRVMRSIRFLNKGQENNFAAGYENCLGWIIAILEGRSDLDTMDLFSTIPELLQTQPSTQSGQAIQAQSESFSK